MNTPHDSRSVRSGALLIGAASLLLVSGLIGCSSLFGDSEEERLNHPSFHILVNEELAVPSTGTFAFDTKLFKVDPTDGVDLAAVDARITRALRAEFESKGMTHVDEKPDLWISYAAALNSPISGEEFNQAYADEFPIDFPVVESENALLYHQGTVIVDVVDSSSHKLLWRGAIMAGLHVEASEADKDRRVRDGARLLLAHYPQPILAEDG